MSIQSQIDRISGAKDDLVTSIEGKGVSVPDGTKLDALSTYVDAIPTAADIPAAGTELGTVKSGGDVTISNGIIQVNDDSHNHTIANVDGLQNALNGKQPSGSYVTTNSTGVQSIAGGLVVGGTSATATGKGRIMVTGSTNPLIGLQAINASGTQLTPYYFQVSNDVMYLGPTSSKALAFDSNGNTSIPAALSVAGSIKENGVALSSKYATPTYVDGKFETLEDAIPTKTSQLTNNSGFATETYVNNKVAEIVDSSPEALNTLNELAAALGDNPNFSTDVLNLIGQKASQADLDDLSGDVENLTTEVDKKANTSSLHKVATSGSYNDLTNKPTIPTKTSQLTNDSGFKTTDNNTTYSLSKSGSTITLTGSDGSTSSVTDSNSTSYLPLSGGSMNTDAKIKLSQWGTRFLTLSGNSIDADMSNETGGWAGNFASVKDPSGATTTMLGWYGGTSLTHIFMGGTYSDPAMKMTPAGQFTFKNTPKVGNTNVALESSLSNYVTNTKLEQVLGSYVNDIDALLGG